jgi:hypothetical protein
MDIQKILADLREQRELVDAVIEALQRIEQQQTRRRGRPPKWLTVNRMQTSKNGANGSMNGTSDLPIQDKSAKDLTLAATSVGVGN